MVLPKRKSILTQEERIARLKESRLKYSQIGKPKNPPVNRNEAPSIGGSSRNVSNVPTRPPALPNRAAPRASLAPKPPKPSSITDADADFEVDPNSLAMIKSGRITFPTNRPSISANRHTIGSRQSIVGKPFSRFRASIAPEPRPSLLPMGINLFEASANQRNEVNSFLSSFATTPAKASTSSTVPGNVFSSVLNSTRSKKIRFMESTIQEMRESAESAEVVAASTHHSPTTNTSFMPASILSTKKNTRKKINLNVCPAPTPRKILFDEEDSTEEPEKENVETEIEQFERMVELFSDPHTRLTDDKQKRIRSAVQKLQESLELRLQNKQEDSISLKSPFKRGVAATSVPLTPLGSILQNVNLEDSSDLEEREFAERKKKKLRRSSRMKAGANTRRSLLNRSSTRDGN